MKKDGEDLQRSLTGSLGMDNGDWGRDWGSLNLRGTADVTRV